MASTFFYLLFSVLTYPLSRRKLDQRVLQAQYVISTLLKQALLGHLPQEYAKVDSPKGKTPIDRQVQRVGGALESPRMQAGTEDTRSHMHANLPGEERRGDASSEQRTYSPSPNAIQGGFGLASKQNHLPHDAKRGDANEERHPYPSTASGEAGRFVSSHLRTHNAQTKTGQAVESTRIEEEGRRTEGALPSNLSVCPTEVDSPAPLRNVDVVNTYEFIITSTLREPQHVSKFFAEQFENDVRVYPKYQKLFTTEGGQPRQPHVLAAAFITTMVRLHRDHWSLDRPGGFFTKQCREFDTAIPPEAEEWITMYGHLSPLRLKETLTQQSKGISPARKSPARLELVPKPAPAPLLPTLELSANVDVHRVTLPADEADALLQEVLHHPVMHSFRAKRIRVGKEVPRYAVLVDTTVPQGPARQTILYQRQDWVDRLAQMETKRHRLASSSSARRGN